MDIKKRILDVEYVPLLASLAAGVIAMTVALFYINNGGFAYFITFCAACIITYLGIKTIGGTDGLIIGMAGGIIVGVNLGDFWGRSLSSISLILLAVVFYILLGMLKNLKNGQKTKNFKNN